MSRLVFALVSLVALNTMPTSAQNFMSRQDGHVLTFGFESPGRFVDLNGDRIPDNIAGGCTTSYQPAIFVQLGKAGGNFGSPISSVVTPDDAFGAGCVSQVEYAHLANTSTIYAVAVLTSYSSNQEVSELVVLTSSGNGSFQQKYTIKPPAPATSLDNVSLADFDNDGKTDLMAQAGPGRVLFYRGNGNGTFASPRTVSSLPSVAPGRVADFDGDGLPDVLVPSDPYRSTKLTVYYNTGGLQFTPKSFTISGMNDINWVRVSDVNFDRRSDILASGLQCATSFTGCGSPHFAVLQSTGRNFRTAAVQTTTTMAGAIITSAPLAADFDGDGISDIAIALHYPVTQILIFRGLASGQYATTPWIYPLNGGNAGAWIVNALDLNQDGRPDLLVDLPTFGNTATMFNAIPRAACANSSLSPSVTVCVPTDRTFSLSPLYVVAKTRDTSRAVTGINVYLDHVLVSKGSGSTLDATIPASLGTHAMTVKAFDSAGTSFSNYRQVTVFNGRPGDVCSTALNTARICSPQSTSAGSVRVFAAAYSSNAPTAAQIYIDGNSIFKDTSRPTYVDQRFSLSTGKHSVTVKFYDGSGGVLSKSTAVTVQ